MKINIISYKLPKHTPSPKQECGWVALHDDKAVGWNSLIFESYDTIKFANAFVEEEYRGNGIYKMLWDERWKYCEENFKGWKVISYCLPTTLEFYKNKGFVEKYTSTLVQSTI